MPRAALSAPSCECCRRMTGGEHLPRRVAKREPLFANSVSVDQIGKWEKRTSAPRRLALLRRDGLCRFSLGDFLCAELCDPLDQIHRHALGKWEANRAFAELVP